MPVVGFEELAQVLPKGALQMWQVDKEIRFLDAHQPAALIQSRAGNQTMNVRMKSHLLVPGVQHGSKAVDARAQSFVGGQLFHLGGLDLYPAQ